MIPILSDPQLATVGPRHYIYLPTWKDHGGGVGPTGRRNAQSLTFGPRTIGKRQIFTFRMADGRNGEKLKGVLRFRVYNATAEDQFNIDLNGTPIPAETLLLDYQPRGEVWDEGEGDKGEGEGCLLPIPKEPPFDHSVPFRWPANLRVDIDLAKCPPFKGDNELGVTLVKKNSVSDKDPVMEALEVKVIEAAVSRGHGRAIGGKKL
jgi:hypothetical protein